MLAFSASSHSNVSNESVTLHCTKRSRVNHTDNIQYNKTYDLNYTEMGNSTSKINRYIRKHNYNAAEKELFCELSKVEEMSLAAANLHDRLTDIYFRLGRMEDAMKHGQMSLATKQKLAPDSMDLARTLSDIGCIYYERREYEQSLYFLEGSQEIRERLEPESLETARVYTNLSVTLNRLHRVEESCEKALQALRIKEKIAPNSSTLAISYICVAAIAIQNHQIDVAAGYLETAKRFPKTHDVTVCFLNNLGNLQATKGDRQGCIKLQRQACEMEKKNLGDSVNLATLYERLALYLDENAETQEEARSFRTQAIAIRYSKVPQSLETRCKKAPPS